MFQPNTDQKTVSYTYQQEALFIFFFFLASAFPHIAKCGTLEEELHKAEELAGSRSVSEGRAHARSFQLFLLVL